MTSGSQATVNGETHYQRHKQEYLDRNKEKKASLRRFLDAVKTFPCTDCGKSYNPWQMQFDHLPGFTKKHEPARLPNTGSWKAVIEEIMKCDVVCANCHADRTHYRSLM